MITFDFLVSLRSKIDNMKTIYTKGLYNEYIARIKIKGIYARKIYFLLSILSDVAQDMFLEGFKWLLTANILTQLERKKIFYFLF